MKFSALYREVMVLREEQGIRGLDREESRGRCHIETAPFFETVAAQIAMLPPDTIRDLAAYDVEQCA